ncbi:LCP family protein [Neobacillus sp. PS3-12]|uniref:LCP family glycopolymer transferase n=1 Tax=Neobacillus sp. PS3-12 TaxID=3070677 RepID=UPI0027DFEDAF|nr:LCP family protein [Neobacillus sp. PS3-12]WML54777.1 LCP family protein [Neobacillus sp. PS3-12]
MISRSQRPRKRKRKLRVFRVTLLAIFILLVGAGVYFYNVYNDVVNAVDKMHKPISRTVSQKRTTEVKFSKKDPITILLVGVDKRKGDSGRTDSMIVATVNPEKKTTTLVSIPRDTKTKIVSTTNPSKNRITKINAAYAYGGIEMTIDTVENFLNIPIDYYVQVNMEGFKDIVNSVGGIDVNNQYAFELDGVTLKKGPQHLNGLQALEYARMRHQDPRGDFGRQDRQKEVITKVIHKGASISTLTNYNHILTALEDNIETNLTMDDIIGVQSNYKAAAKTINKVEITGDGKNTNSGWYYFVSDKTRQQLSNQLRVQLGLKPGTVSRINIYQ